MLRVALLFAEGPDVQMQLPLSGCVYKHKLLIRVTFIACDLAHAILKLFLPYPSLTLSPTPLIPSIEATV